MGKLECHRTEWKRAYLWNEHVICLVLCIETIFELIVEDEFYPLNTRSYQDSPEHDNIAIVHLCFVYNTRETAPHLDYDNKPLNW